MQGLDNRIDQTEAKENVDRNRHRHQNEHDDQDSCDFALNRRHRAVIVPLHQIGQRIAVGNRLIEQGGALLLKKIPCFRCISVFQVRVNGIGSSQPSLHGIHIGRHLGVFGLQTQSIQRLQRLVNFINRCVNLRVGIRIVAKQRHIA